jgi:hypothetical protein
MLASDVSKSRLSLAKLVSERARMSGGAKMSQAQLKPHSAILQKMNENS